MKPQSLDQQNFINGLLARGKAGFCSGTTRVAVVFGVGLSSVAAHAAAGDVDTSAITAAATQVSAVGLAVFGVYVGIKLWKWIRQGL